MLTTRRSGAKANRNRISRLLQRACVGVVGAKQGMENLEARQLLSLLPGWQSLDIGYTSPVGSTVESGTDAYTVIGGGTDIWDTADHFQFAFNAFAEGDASIEARTVSMSASDGSLDGWAKAGVMMRFGTAADDPYIAILNTQSNSVRWQYRLAKGGGSSSGGVAGIGRDNLNVKLTREGNTFTGYYKVEGGQQVGTPQNSFQINFYTYQGAVAQSGSYRVYVDGATGEHRMQLLYNGTTPALLLQPDWTTYADHWNLDDPAFTYDTNNPYTTGIPLLTTLIPSSKTNTPSPEYPFSVNTVSPDPGNPWNQALNANTIVPTPAPVAIGATGPVVQAGVTTTVGTDWIEFFSGTAAAPNGMYMGLAVTAHEGNNVLNTVQFDKVMAVAAPAAAPGAPINFTGGFANNDGFFYWADDASNEDSMELQRSTDQVNWTTVQTLAADSNSTTTGVADIPDGKAYFRVVATNELGSSASAAIVAVKGALPNGFTLATVGSATDPTRPSIGYIDGSTYAISADGSDIWNQDDHFGFLYKQLQGDGYVEARVTEMGPMTNEWAKAGVMLRDSLDMGSAHGMTAISYLYGSTFQRRPETGGASADTTTGDRTIQAGSMIKIQRVGNTFYSYYKPFAPLFNIRYTPVTDDPNLAATVEITNGVMKMFTGPSATELTQVGSVNLADYGNSVSYLAGVVAAWGFTATEVPGVPTPNLASARNIVVDAYNADRTMRSTQLVPDWIALNATGTMLDVTNSMLAGLAVTSHANGATINAKFDSVNVVDLPDTLNTPKNVAASIAINNLDAVLSWSDDASNETAFIVERAWNSTFTSNVVSFEVGADLDSLEQAGLDERRYYYRIKAVQKNGGGTIIAESAWSPTVNLLVGPQDGLFGEYFNRVQASIDDNNQPGLPGTWTQLRIDPMLNYQTLEPGTIAGSTYAADFQTRWEGSVTPTVTDVYTFYSDSDDGVRVWVNGQLMTQSWVGQGMGTEEASAPIFLEAGKNYPIIVEHYDSGGGSGMRLRWSSASVTKQVIPGGILTTRNAPADVATGLSATPTATGAKLRWTNSALNDTATRVEIINADDPQATWQQVTKLNVIANPGGQAVTATVTAGGLQPETNYKFRVLTYNILGAVVSEELAFATTAITAVEIAEPAAIPSNVNLTQEGNLDWAMWGMVPENAMLPTYRDGTRSIQNFTVINGGVPVSVVISGSTYSWNNGQPLIGDYSNPGDPVVGTSTNVGGGGAEGPAQAIDNNVNTKYLNFDKENSGLTVELNAAQIVNALRLFSANDAVERDPSSVTIEGSNDGTTFTQVAYGVLIQAFTARYQPRVVTFDNSTAYKFYKITFPTVADSATANSMQISEIEFLQQSPYISVPVMNDQTQPFDYIVGSSTNTPGAETVDKAIDNSVSTKYLNFDELNTGFTVTLGAGAQVVTALSLTSADDAPERDPASYVLEGSNDGGTTFAPIAQGTVPVFSARLQRKVIEFANSTAYSTYRLTFPTVANAAAANSMQIAEVELLKADPATVANRAVSISGADKGFQMQFSAGTDARTLKLYVGVNGGTAGATGELRVTMSDGSAAEAVETLVAGAGQTNMKVFEIPVQAGSANQTMTVRWVVQPTNPSDTQAAVILQAATLIETSAPTAPVNVIAVPYGASPVVDLTWSDESTNEDGFRVQWMKNGNWETLATVAPGTTSYRHRSYDIMLGQTYEYRVVAFNAVGESATTTSVTIANALPAGWNARDIGDFTNPVAIGTGLEIDGKWLIQGGGSDIWDAADHGSMSYVAITGDVTMTTRAVQVGDTDGWAKAGIMMRVDPAAPGSQHFYMATTNSNGISFQRRETANGGSASTDVGGGVRENVWLRLQRVGDTFTGFWSMDGVNWVQASAHTIDYPDTIYVGLAVTAHNNDGRINTSVFDNVSLTKPADGSQLVLPYAPKAPTKLEGFQGPQGAFLRWSPAFNATNYIISMENTETAEITTFDAGNKTQYTVSGLTNGVEYRFTVHSKTVIGATTYDGGDSLAVLVTPANVPPLAPSGVTVTATALPLNIRWNVSPFATSYEVERTTQDPNVVANPVWTDLTGAGSIAQPASGDTVSFSDTTAVAGTTYFYRISAKNDAVPTPAYGEVFAYHVGTGHGIYGTYYSARDDNNDTDVFTNPSGEQMWGAYSQFTTRLDKNLNLPDNFATPLEDNFAVIWNGQIVAPTTGTFTFFGIFDDAGRIVITGPDDVAKTVINQPSWANHSEQFGYMDMVAGELYDIQVQLREDGGGEDIFLRWQSPVGVKEFIPMTQFYAPESTAVVTTQPTLSASQDLFLSKYAVNLMWDEPWGSQARGYEIQRRMSGETAWTKIADLPDGTTTYRDVLADPNHAYQYRISAYVSRPDDGWSTILNFTPAAAPALTGTGLEATYYDNIDFTGPTVKKVDPTVDYNWGNGLPTNGIGADSFSVVYTGTVIPAYTDNYTFFVASDDGSRLYVNGQLVIADNWVDQGETERASQAIPLQSGVPVVVRMEMYENGGGAAARLRWESANTPKQIIPQMFMNPGTVGQPAAPTNITATTNGADSVRLEWWNPAANDAGFEIQQLKSGTWETVYTTPAAHRSVGYARGLEFGQAYSFRIRALAMEGGMPSGWTQIDGVTLSDSYADGLVGYWSFDLDTNNQAGDYMHGQLTDQAATPNNSNVFIDAGTNRVGGGAAYFDDDTGRPFVRVANDNRMNWVNPYNDGITVSAWINAKDWSGNHRILQKSNGDSQYRLLCENGRLIFDLGTVNGVRRQATSPLPTTNAWHYVAGTFDGSTIRIYVDGQLMDEQTGDPVGRLNWGGDPLYIGAKAGTDTAANPNNDYFNGWIDEVRLHNRALTEEGIKAMMGYGAGTIVDPAAEKPTGVTATSAADNYVQVRWTDNSNWDMGFQVERSADGGATWALATEIGGTYFFEQLAAEGGYQHRVRAIGATGGVFTDWSDVANVTAVVDPENLTDPWIGADVGGVAATGSTVIGTDGVITVTGSGADIWGAADEFQYAFQPISGDFMVVTRIAEPFAGANEWRKAGLMIRQTTLNDSPNALLLYSGRHGVQFGGRRDYGNTTEFTTMQRDQVTPYWLALRKDGDWVSAFRSVDGVNWIQQGSTQYLPNLGDDVYVGLAVTSHADGTLNTATFDNFNILRPTDVPMTPALSTTLVGDGTVKLDWGDVAYATAYEVTRTDTSTSEVVVRTFTTTNLTDTGLTNGVEYTYAIKALVGTVESGVLNASATPLATQQSAGALPIADTYVRYNTTENGATTGELVVKADGNWREGNTRWTYMKWDLASLMAGLPEGAIVTGGLLKATAWMPDADNDTKDDSVFGLQASGISDLALSQVWNDSDLSFTWAQRPGTTLPVESTFAAYDPLRILDTETIMGTQNLHQSLTFDVSKWIMSHQADSEVSFMIQTTSKTGGGRHFYASRENANEAERPQLVLTYYVPSADEPIVIDPVAGANVYDVSVVGGNVVVTEDGVEVANKPLANVTAITLGDAGDSLIIAAGDLAGIPVTFGGDSVNATGTGDVQISDTAVQVGATAISTGAKLIQVDATGTASGALAKDGDKVVRLSNVQIGALDLNNNSLIVDCADASSADAMRKLLAGGITGGTLTSSELAKPERRLAVVTAGDLALTNPVRTQFAGQAVNDNSVLVKYTWTADYTFDGQVTTADFAELSKGYVAYQLTGGESRFNAGDSNLDGKVTTADFAFLSKAYVQSQVEKSQGGTGMAATVAQDQAETQTRVRKTHRLPVSRKARRGR